MSIIIGFKFVKSPLEFEGADSAGVGEKNVGVDGVGGVLRKLLVMPTGSWGTSFEFGVDSLVQSQRDEQPKNLHHDSIHGDFVGDCSSALVDNITTSSPKGSRGTESWLVKSNPSRSQ